jgi:hypothetical protein
MSQKTRIIIGIVVLVVLVGVVLGVDQIQRRSQAAAMPELVPGAIPIYIDGVLTSGFVPDDLDELPDASFVDDEEGKTQEGWMLNDILLLYIDEKDLKEDTQITVSSSSREKSFTLTWAQVADQENMVMFDLSGRGTLKLVSNGVEGLAIRDEWVQDVDKIEVSD